MNHLKWIVALSCIGSSVSTSFAAEATNEVKSEFRQLVVKRDRLVRELATIDDKAADAVAHGGDPMAMHAQQIELQDTIDLMQLKLETMSVRWELVIPSPPVRGSAEMNEAAVTNNKIESAFQGGRDRTDQVLRERCIQMLASINYEAFLAQVN